MEMQDTTSHDNFLNKGTVMTNEDFKEIYSVFYESNRKLIEENKIIYISEPWSEIGVIINIETKETLFLDYRS